MRTVLSALFSFALLASPALAQTSEAEARRAALEAREAAERRVEDGMITMTSLVEAMAKNLGQMHYLRTLCFGANDQYWRDYMSQMLELESGENYDQRRELTRAFNTGYYEEQARHSQCSEAVAVDVAALAENGRSLASMLGDPYRTSG
jgi:uncharacterized protein (TIGR02301 family)